jgi:hypothetical protein
VINKQGLENVKHIYRQEIKDALKSKSKQGSKKQTPRKEEVELSRAQIVEQTLKESARFDPKKKDL